MPALLLPNEILSMSAQAARRLVEAGEGDCALLYLALLERGDVKKAGKALHWNEGRLAAVYGRLAELGLAAAEQAPVPESPAQSDEMPVYTRQDVAEALQNEPDFLSLYREVERLLGRTLGDADLQTLYGIYDAMDLPTEVILLLVNHKIHEVRRSTGKAGAMPRMPQIRSEAARWKRLGLENMAVAEEYLRKQELINSREWAILAAVGMTEERPAVKDERVFINNWVELGFSDELIRLAYEKTVFQKGKMNWAYMNKILLSWHQSGWKTVEQIRAGDKPAGGKKPTGQGKRQPDYQPDDERIRKNAEKLKKLLEEEGR